MDGYHGEGGETQGGATVGEQPEQTERRGGDGMFSELARRAVATSVSKLVETEGFVREVVKAMSRELAGYVSREVHGLRQDMVEQVGDQVGRWLDRVDMANELRRGLNGMTFDIQIKVKVTDDGVKPVGKPPVKKPARKSARKPASL